MRFGVLILPDERWSVAKQRWQTAERLGFDHAWTYDHLTWRSLRDHTWFGSTPTLTAAAAATTSIRIGTLVASPNFRHPAPFAKELMTIDDISNGRLTLGFGAGAEGFDAYATRDEPWSATERQGRFSEFVKALDLLLTHSKSSHRGRYYTANEARAIPGCVQQPRIPFALAATGTKGLRVVARHAQMWVTVDGRGAGRAQVAHLERVCEEEGRDAQDIRKLVLLGHTTNPLASSSAFKEITDEFESYGFTDAVVHWPRASDPFKANLKVLERIATDWIA